jgi:SAM-dependent methyltransferase
MADVHFDGLAALYSHVRQATPANRYFYDFWSEQMLAQVPIPLTGSVTLDCMSGSCEFARVAGKRVGVLYATDISLGILQRAEADTQLAGRACADARLLPYGADTFDVAFVRGGLHHVPDTFVHVLAELHRVLKPGGWLVCSEPVDDNPIVQAARGFLHRISPHYDPEERGLRLLDLLRGFDEAGFSQIDVQPFGYVAYTLIGNMDVFPLFRRLRNKTCLRFLTWIDHVSPRVPGWRRLALTRMIRGRVT